MESFTIKTPCSSANIGPGFDVIGLALSVYLELQVTIDRTKASSQEPLNCRITYEGQGEESGEVPLDPSANLITRVALYVLRCHDQRTFPVETHVHIKNPIPLGRGLGSSGAAVVAGVMLGKEVGGLDLTPERLFDFCLMIGKSFALDMGVEKHAPVERALAGSAVIRHLADMSNRTTPRQRWSCTIWRLHRHISQASYP